MKAFIYQSQEIIHSTFPHYFECLPADAGLLAAVSITPQRANKQHLKILSTGLGGKVE